LIFYHVSHKNHPNWGRKAVSEQTQKNFVQKWPKVGNYFKKVHFLENSVPLKNALKKGLNEFKLKWKSHENVAQGFFFNMNKLSLGFIAYSAHISALKKTSKWEQTWQCCFSENESG